MPSLDPHIEALTASLAAGLRALDVPFCVVGALVPELLLETRPESRTNDADVVVLVPDLAAFDALKRELEEKPYEFKPTAVPHRLERRAGGFADVLPYSGGLAPDGRLRLGDDRVMNVAGFDRVIGAAIGVRLDSGLELPVAPLPLYVLLKLVAYSDRKMTKDLEGVEHVLRHYASDDDRLWGLAYEGALVEYDYGPAYLLGIDGREYLGPELIQTLSAVLGVLVVADARVATTERAVDYDDVGGKEAWKPSFERLLFWYRRGLGL
jgi:predicted nucleotidyltransferase